jgi:hypothetical protein
MYTDGQKAAANYIMGMCQGRIMPDASLPCTDCRPFRELVAHWRIVPVVDGNNEVVIMFNPHFMWCNTGVNYNNSTTSVTAVPPVGICNTTNTYITPTSTSGISSVGTIDNSSTQYSGDIRFLGAEVTFQNTSTVVNAGGQLYFVHNPEARSLLWTNADTTAGTMAIRGETGTNTLLAATDITAFHNVGVEPIHWCVLPHSAEFESLTTNCSLNTANPVAANIAAAQALISPYVPDQLGERAHAGWTQLIAYFPAQSISSGSSAQCIIDITAHYHLDVAPQTNSTGNIWGQPAGVQLTSSSVADPAASSAVSTAIALAQKARSQMVDTVMTAASERKPDNFGQAIVDGLMSIASPVASLVGSFFGTKVPGRSVRQLGNAIHGGGGYDNVFTGRPAYPVGPVGANGWRPPPGQLMIGNG